MAKKKTKILYDSPVVLTFSILCTALFLIDSLALHGKLVSTVFSCRAAFTQPKFDFKNVLDYFRLIFHVFGNVEWPVFFMNLLAVLSIGPQLEERYGSAMLALMCGISALVTGVLTACLGNTVLCGAGCIVFMMIFLASFTTLGKKTVHLTWSGLLVLYAAYSLYSQNQQPRISLEKAGVFSAFMQQNLVTFMNMAGGICGSLFGFLVSPKKRAAPKKPAFSDSDEIAEEPVVRKWSPEPKEKKKSKSAESEDTVIGTIDL